jgi:transposase-like protein
MAGSIAEQIAEEFHNTYAKLARDFGVASQTTRQSWSQVPRNHQLLLLNTIRDLLDNGVIEVPDRSHTVSTVNTNYL